MSRRFSILAGLAIAATPSGFHGNPSFATTAPSVYSCTRSLRFIRIHDALQTLEQVFVSEKHPLHFSVPGDGMIHFESADAGLVAEAERVLGEIDGPPRCAPTRFVRLDHLPVITTSEWLLKWKPPGDSEPSFLAIPDPGTKRVFIMGASAEANRAAALLRHLDDLHGFLTRAKGP